MRPAIRNVYCVYGAEFSEYRDRFLIDLGINMPTEIGYRYDIADGYPWSLADVYVI